ncbi:MAG: hypothetical protein H6999_12030 [Hahellaceae bacterium]|nr:hypothetical protein [Hahellaceae bacterium]MCP5170470.1 hypothetical protein [Hahellaceae bacterium]
MKKLLFTVTLLALTVYVTFKVWVWYQAEQLMAGWKDSLAGEAAISYRWIYSSLEGEVGISGLSVTPFRLKETIEIEDARIKFANVFELLKLGELASGYLPEQLRVWLSGASITVRDLSFQEVGVIGSGDLSLDVLEVPQCGPQARLSGPLLQAMGLNVLVSNLDMSYRRRPLADNVVWESTWDLEGVGRVGIEADLPLPQGGWSVLSLTNALLHPQKMSIAVHDAGITRRLALICGERSQHKRAELATLMTQDRLAGLQQVGILPGRGLQQLLQVFLAEGGVMAFDMTPTEPLGFQQWPSDSSVDLERKWGLQAHINGQRVSDLGWQIDAIGYERLWNKTPDPDDQKRPKVVTEHKPEWQQVLVVDAGKMVGHTVKVVLETGKTLEGVLSGESEYVVEVSQMVSSGVIAYPLKKREIVDFQVWR